MSGNRVWCLEVHHKFSSDQLNFIKWKIKGLFCIFSQHWGRGVFSIPDDVSQKKYQDIWEFGNLARLESTMHDPRWCLPNKRLAIQQYKTHFINLKHVWQSNTIAVLQALAQSPSRLFLWSGIACVTLLQVHTFSSAHFCQSSQNWPTNTSSFFWRAINFWPKLGLCPNWQMGHKKHCFLHFRLF